jgi:hypothetical protein
MLSSNLTLPLPPPIKGVSQPGKNTVVIPSTSLRTSLSEAKNLIISRSYKIEILQLTPQNDIMTQSHRGRGELESLAQNVGSSFRVSLFGSNTTYRTVTTLKGLSEPSGVSDGSDGSDVSDRYILNFSLPFLRRKKTRGYKRWPCVFLVFLAFLESPQNFLSIPSTAKLHKRHEKPSFNSVSYKHWTYPFHHQSCNDFAFCGIQGAHPDP